MGNQYMTREQVSWALTFLRQHGYTQVIDRCVGSDAYCVAVYPNDTTNLTSPWILPTVALVIAFA